jgi:hypothetical protein
VTHDTVAKIIKTAQAEPIRAGLTFANYAYPAIIPLTHAISEPMCGRESDSCGALYPTEWNAVTKELWRDCPNLQAVKRTPDRWTRPAD